MTHLAATHVVREDVGLVRQSSTTRFDEIDTGKAVLEGNLLSSEVLLDREGVVSTALDRGVVGNDHAAAARDGSDTSDDTSSGQVVGVDLVSGEGRELEEGRVRVEEGRDTAVSGGSIACSTSARCRRSRESRKRQNWGLPPRSLPCRLYTMRCPSCLAQRRSSAPPSCPPRRGGCGRSLAPYDQLLASPRPSPALCRSLARAVLTAHGLQASPYPCSSTSQATSCRPPREP